MKINSDPLMKTFEELNDSEKKFISKLWAYTDDASFLLDDIDFILSLKRKGEVDCDIKFCILKNNVRIDVTFESNEKFIFRLEKKYNRYSLVNAYYFDDIVNDGTYIDLVGYTKIIYSYGEDNSRPSIVELFNDVCCDNGVLERD